MAKGLKFWIRVEEDLFNLCSGFINKGHLRRYTFWSCTADVLQTPICKKHGLSQHSLYGQIRIKKNSKISTNFTLHFMQHKAYGTIYKGEPAHQHFHSLRLCFNIKLNNFSVMLLSPPKYFPV